jgi:hypothetical protein
MLGSLVEKFPFVIAVTVLFYTGRAAGSIKMGSAVDVALRGAVCG